MEKSLDQQISEIRNIGDQLIYYNFPQADPMLEDSLGRVKTKTLIIDGYSVVIHFSKADYKDRYMETVQAYGEKTPFLPFYLVAKIARKFLGSSNLSLVEIYKDNKKIYCWAVTLDRNGKSIPTVFGYDVEHLNFEGWDYVYIDPSFVNIY